MSDQPVKSSASRLSDLRREIEARVRPTICPTFSSDGGERIEGRISLKDFEVLVLLAAGKTPGAEPHLDSERAQAALIAAFMKSEIERLMHQAEHWAKNEKPLAVHHRLCKADAYFQILCLFDRFTTFNENPFEKMRDDIARSAGAEKGKYPPDRHLNQYREPEFVTSRLQALGAAARS